MSCLTTLSLAGNYLKKASLPSLKTLTVLNLKDNSIKAIIGLGSLIKLRQLVVLGNQLKKLPIDFLKLKNLESLIYDSGLKFDQDEQLFLRNLGVRMNQSGFIPHTRTPGIILKPKSNLNRLNSELWMTVNANEDVLSKHDEIIKAVTDEKREARKAQKENPPRRRGRRRNNGVLEEQNHLDVILQPLQEAFTGIQQIVQSDLGSQMSQFGQHLSHITTTSQNNLPANNEGYNTSSQFPQPRPEHSESLSPQHSHDQNNDITMTSQDDLPPNNQGDNPPNNQGDNDVNMNEWQGLEFPEDDFFDFL